MTFKLLPVLGLCLIPLAEAHAQANDMAYCAELTAMYRKFLGQTSARATMPDVTASSAIESCEKGNPGAGIPVLEKKLTDARFTLPKRS
jgi:hypothetical protein